ncbi:MAG: LPS assembly protein LptD [Gammaproteobacteria bacterium]|nr:LPS assembly protein LptD [Gammaproteobacteria bacterium]NNM12034.1 LPS-assembly protein LptD [Pseudomonadales bacterium]RZV59953.1 MAG: LPS-assembly protein LptD [Pseudomonadales bacterium]
MTQPRAVVLCILLVLLPAQASRAETIANDGWLCRDIVEQGVTIRSCKSQPAGNPKTAAAQAGESTQSMQPAIDVKTAPPASAAMAVEGAAAPVESAAATVESAEAPIKSTTAPVTSASQGCNAAPAGNGANDDSTAANIDLVKPPGTPVEASALELNLLENVAEYVGEVEITSGAAKLKAQRATYNRVSQVVELEGEISADVPMAKVQGARAEVNLSDNSSHIEDAEYELRDRGTRGRADSISIDAQRRVSIDNGSYTRCPENNKHWEVRAGRIALDTENGQGSARDATLRLYNTPVLYFPYARFPIGDQRQSGLLFPRLSDTRAGTDLALPYYFNIAPNIDATLTPRFVSEAGYLTEGELRWLNFFDEWALSGAYIGDDDKTNQDRWLLDIKERGEAQNGLSSEIVFTRTSDANYLRDLSASSIAVNRSTHLEQRASVAWHKNYLALGVNAQRFQTLDTSLQQSLRPYATEPELWLNYQRPASAGQVATHLELRAASYQHDTLTGGERGFGQLDFELPINWRGLEITPSLGLQHLQYNLDSALPGRNERKPSQTARFAAFDVSANWLKLKKQADNTVSRRVVTPRLRYLHRALGSSASDTQDIPLFDSKWHSSNTQLLFGNSRIAGYDLLEPAEQLSAGVTHAVFAREGYQRGELTLGQVFFFDRRTLRGIDIASAISGLESETRSALLGDYRWQHSKRLQSVGNLQWQSDSNRMQRGSWQLRYRGDEIPGGGRQLANLGYRYWRANPADLLLAEDIEQVDASVVTALNDSWQLLARYQYDLTGGRSAESLIGLQFDDCCLQLRLVYRDGLIYAPLDDAPGAGVRAVRDHTFYIQVEFKGLAGVGRGLQNVLEESIFGYEVNQ